MRIVRFIKWIRWVDWDAIGCRWFVFKGCWAYSKYKPPPDGKGM